MTDEVRPFLRVVQEKSCANHDPIHSISDTELANLLTEHVLNSPMMVPDSMLFRLVSEAVERLEGFE